MSGRGVVQRIGLITLNRPDLERLSGKARYLYVLDRSIVSLWDIILLLVHG